MVFLAVTFFAERLEAPVELLFAVFFAAGFLAVFRAAGLRAVFLAAGLRAVFFAGLAPAFLAAGRADFLEAVDFFFEAAFLGFAFAVFLEAVPAFAGAALFTALFFLEAFLVAIGFPFPFDACNLDPWQLRCLKDATIRM